MIIWRGAGFLVAVIVFVSSLIANLITDAANTDGYYDHHKWPFALSLFASAIACWFLGRYLNGRPGKVLIEKDTGREITIPRTHDLFFIKVEYWGPILAVIGIIVLIVGLAASSQD